jgi:hypothetical protein
METKFKLITDNQDAIFTNSSPKFRYWDNEAPRIGFVVAGTPIIIYINKPFELNYNDYVINKTEESIKQARIESIAKDFNNIFARV